MGTILQADENGTLHLPPSVLPHPGPHRRYRVAAEGGQVVVDEAKPESVEGLADHQAWLRRLEFIRARGARGKAGVPLQQVLDEIREDRH